MEAVGRVRESKNNQLNEKIKVVTFIHDILPILEPQWFTQEMVENFEKNLKFALYNSNLLIVSSKTVGNDVRQLSLVKNLEATFPKVERVDISSVSKNFMSSEKILKKKNLNEPLVILLISTIEPRKGYDELIDAASQALSEGANLKFIVVGRIGWVSDLFYSKFVKFNKTFADSICWLKNCDDEMLASLIPTIDIFLSPSRGEGYGIPITEALIAGVPTFARDLPVYRELYDEYVAFYGPGNEFPDLYSALINIEKIQKIASTKIEKFSPTESQDSIKSLLEVFGKISYD
jgi:glycosyltransferase involved in cell wall biosynthesis